MLDFLLFAQSKHFDPTVVQMKPTNDANCFSQAYVFDRQYETLSLGALLL